MWWPRRRPQPPQALVQPFAFDVAVLTDPGCERPLNEDHGRGVRPGDAETLRRRGLLLLVADGMGGHAAGEVASSTAVERIARAYYASDDPPPAALDAAFRQANRAIHAEAEGERVGMGTTCVALVLRGAEAFLAHVGDSRAYRLRGGTFERLTVDHSFVAELVAAGALSEEEARAHEQRNVITRALGIRPEVEPTVTGPLAVEPEDVFVLCSDGLHDPVRDEEIAEALGGASPLAAAERLVALARERGGPDNITVAVAAAREASWRHPSASGAAPDPRATRELPALPAEASP